MERLADLQVVTTRLPVSHTWVGGILGMEELDGSLEDYLVGSLESSVVDPMDDTLKSFFIYGCQDFICLLLGCS